MKTLRCLLLAATLLFVTACAPDAPPGASSGTQADYDALASQFSIDQVFDAYTVLRDVVQMTPLVDSPALSDKAGVFLKLESLQTTGSFKLRGAYYAVSRLTPQEQERGVITCSAGNHAQGVALAAVEYGIKATIFIPETAPQAKIDDTKAYGVDVRVGGADFSEAKEAAEAYARQSGGVYISPYDDVGVIAGQGTIAWEVLMQNPDVEVIVVPIGGGGLMSGVSGTIKTLKPSCMVYGVEAEGYNSMQLSLEAGKPVSVSGQGTLADGIAVSAPSDLTFAICQKYVDDIVTVTDEQVADAMLFMLDEHKLVVEGAGAVSVAAIINDLLPTDGKNVVCVVSGGNLDDKTLAELIRSRDAA